MKIYTPQGTLITDAPVTKSAIIRCALMGDHYIEIPFESASILDIPRGSYITYLGAKYKTRIKSYPEHINKAGYKYVLQFWGRQHDMKDATFFWRECDIPEATFNLTTDLNAYAELIVDNMNAFNGGSSRWHVGDVSGDTVDEAKHISFDGISCWEAIESIAKTFDVEWWVKDNGTRLYVYFGKLESGEYIELREGEEVTAFPARRGVDDNYGTRFFFFGGCKNIPDDYYTSEIGGATNHISEKRLHLPEGIDYIDAFEDMTHVDIIEKVVKFDDIYPKSTESVTAVEEVIRTINDENNTAYVIKCDDIAFTPEDVIDDTISATFISGDLVGRSFDLIYKKGADFDKSFELVSIIEDAGGDDYVIIPNEYLKPSALDEFILGGIKLAEEKIREAEDELLARGQAWAEEHSQDTNVYECPTNAVYCQMYNIAFDLGQRVTLIGSQFKDGRRVSRVQGFEKKLYNPYEATYSIGDNQIYSRSKALNNKFTAIMGAESARIKKVSEGNRRVSDADVINISVVAKQALDSVGTFEGRVSTLEGEIKNVETIATNAGTIAAKEAVENDPTIKKASADAENALNIAESASQKVDTQASQNITMQQTITQHTAQITELETGVVEANETAEAAKAQAKSAQSKATTAQSAAEASAEIANEAKAIAESAVQPGEITADMVNRYADSSNNGGLTTSWQTAVPLLPALRANRLAFLPYDDFYVEEAKDGVTFTRVTTTNEMLDMWCNGIGGYPLYPNKGWDVGSKVRITIAPQRYMYAFIDILAIYIYGNGRTFDIEAEACSKPAEGAEPQWVRINSASTTSAQTETYAMMTYRKFVGFPAYANGWGMRLTFTITKNLNSQSIISGIYGFSDRNSFLGINKDTAPQTLGSLYTWDRYKNVTFPGIIQAKIGTFTDNLSTSGAFSATGSISGYGLTLTAGTEDAVLQGNGAPIGKDTLLKDTLKKPSTQPYGNNLMVWDADNETVKDSGYSVATSVQSLEWMEPEEVPTCEQIAKYISDAIPTEVATATQICEYSLDDLVQGNYVVRIHPNVLTDVARGNSLMGRLICAVSGVSNQYDNVWRVRVYTNSPIIFVDAESDNALSIMWDNGVAPVYEGDVACVWDIRLRQYGELWLGEYKQYKE